MALLVISTPGVQWLLFLLNSLPYGILSLSAIDWTTISSGAFFFWQQSCHGSSSNNATWKGNVVTHADDNGTRPCFCKNKFPHLRLRLLALHVGLRIDIGMLQELYSIHVLHFPMITNLIQKSQSSVSAHRSLQVISKEPLDASVCFPGWSPARRMAFAIKSSIVLNVCIETMKDDLPSQFK